MKVGVSKLGMRLDFRDADTMDVLDCAWFDESDKPPGLVWTPSQYLQEMQVRNTHAIVCTEAQGPRIVAVVIYRSWPALGVMHLIRVAVHPGHRRQGIGRVTVGAAIADCLPDLTRFVRARIHESDKDSGNFLVECQFVIDLEECEYCYLRYYMDVGSRVIERLMMGDERTLKSRFSWDL